MVLLNKSDIILKIDKWRLLHDLLNFMDDYGLFDGLSTFDRLTTQRELTRIIEEAERNGD